MGECKRHLSFQSNQATPKRQPIVRPHFETQQRIAPLLLQCVQCGPNLSCHVLCQLPTTANPQHQSSCTVTRSASKAASKSVWLAANPSKRWAEVFFLAYSPFWILWALCILVPFQLYEVRGPYSVRHGGVDAV
jgi:hypothetical protein